MNNSKKYLFLIVIILLVVIGVSLAYFGITIIGNDTAKGNKVVTGNLELTFTDTNEISLENAFPGDSFTKTISVKNTGTKEVSYNLVWTELNNEITNNELIIEATCKSLNSSGTEGGTCEVISQTPVGNNIIKKNISIEPNVTHEYTIKVTFVDIGSVQNYNKNKSFVGKFGVEEYSLPTSISFAEDSWETIAELVSAGKISNYNVGDTKTVDMGKYGTHTLRIANTSTPSECSTTGFSQTACGFVLEFADIITKHAMNDTVTNEGGWPATSMRTFVNNDIYNALPSEIKNAIIDTTVVSGHGESDTENFTSTDKLYLLSTAEVWANTISSSNIVNKGNDNIAVFSLPAPDIINPRVGDNARNATRQLDYYKNLGVIIDSDYSGAIKKNGTTASGWWLRSIISTHSYHFYSVHDNGFWEDDYGVTSTYGVSPAFRIG